MNKLVKRMMQSPEARQRRIGRKRVDPAVAAAIKRLYADDLDLSPTDLVYRAVLSAKAAWRARAVDPKPLKAEAAKLKAQIARLVDALEDGDLPKSEVGERLRDRKAKLEHVEGLLQGGADAEAFDVAKHRDHLLEIVEN